MVKKVNLHGKHPIASTLLIAGTCAIGFLIWYFVSASPIPSRYRSGLNYSLYYPSQLPNDYTVDKTSFRRKDAVLIFSLTAPRGRTIAVSEERLPAGINLNSSSQSGISLPTQRSFTTAIGPATLSLWGSNTVVSIQAGGTWILLNVTGINPETALSVGSSFKPL
jgi:hypothetical protein